MNVGFIGSGNMARAIAMGIGRPAAFADGGSGKAAALAKQLDGTAASVPEVAKSSDMLFLCHKPAQLQSVAEEIGVFGGTLISVLAATDLEALRAAYPNASVIRTMPNTPVEFGTGVVCVAAESDVVPDAAQ